MEDLYLQVVSSINKFTLRDGLDIIIVAYVLYRVLRLVQHSRAMQVLKGLGVLLVLSRVCDMLKLITVTWLLDTLISAGALVIIILFQPELRSALERIGRKTARDVTVHRETDVANATSEIHRAVMSMSKQRIGALIVIEQMTQLGEIIATGTIIDSVITATSIETIFYPGTALHDGAMIIKGLKIAAAGCFLPLTDNENISKTMGTRHRAAIGISEQSDSVTIVVSEETGAISKAEDGKISTHLDSIELKQLLDKLFNNTAPKKKPWDKIIRRQKDEKTS